VGAEPVEVEPGTSKFDLSLSLHGARGGMRAGLRYRTDLFEPATAARMLGHLGRVLEQVAADPGVRLSRLELLDGSERRRLLEEWNHTGGGGAVDGCIHTLFEAQAARTPGAAALTCAGQTVTYAGLDARANRLARHLARLGVGPETRVGLCQERGVEMVVALLAILKAGGAYVPLDPGYPAERLRFMLADAAVAVLVTEEKLRAALALPPGVRVVSVDAAAAQVVAEGAEPLENRSGARSLAYVMYTSGSTGTPRGVAVEHRGVVRLVRGAGYAELGPEQVVLQAAPVSFDASTLEIWGALLNGGRLVLLPGSAAAADEVGRALVRHGVTTLWLTAGLFQVMVEERLEELAGVRQLLAGGDVLSVDAVRRVRERFPGCRVINGYGPTGRPRTPPSPAATPSATTGTAGRCPSAPPSPTPACTCWTGRCARCPWACPASCTRAAPAWRAAT
jgi:aspartate racemase